MDDEIKQEITIIKRKKRKDDCHHGGVWKIAYADFMTAMMAFFLVMWLINASNEETRAQVASYFNPVKLVDSTAQPRGLNDKDNEQKSTEHAVENKTSNGTVETKNDKKKEKKQQGKSKKPESAETTGKLENPGKTGDEAELFRSPIEVLDKIAGGSKPNLADAGRGHKNGANTGEMKEHKYRDPFAPKNWQVLKVEPTNSASGAKRQQPEEKSKTLTLPSLAKRLVTEMKDKADKADKAKAKSMSKTGEKTAPAPVIKVARKTNPDNKKAQTGEKQADKQSTKIVSEKQKQQDSKKNKKLAQVKSAIARATIGKDPKQLPQVDVVKTDKGVLLSLSDDAEFGMFNVASAKPAKELVLFMENISKVLVKQPGKIVIRGHTDGRPFHSKDYDNWRLSSARAQVARYMLIRGGTEEGRFVRIEGHADRNLKMPDQPYDARNRRIEILLLD